MPEGENQLKASNYVTFVKKHFTGLSDYQWFLANEEHVIFYGESRKNVYFTCASCGDTCVSCEKAKIFDMNGIKLHVDALHSTKASQGKV